MKNFMKSKAFTLVEMLIVIVIIGILVAALLPRLQGAQGRARDVQRQTTLSQIGTAITQFYADYGGFPWQVATCLGSGAYTGNIKNYLIDQPTDPIADTTAWFKGMPASITNACKGAYIFIPGKKRFILVSVQETLANANYADNSGNTTLNLLDKDKSVDGFKVCDPVYDATDPNGTSASPGCKAGDILEDLRYVYMGSV